MIGNRKLAGLAFIGGAALAVLSGCAPVGPSYQPPAYFNSSAAAMRAYLEQQQRAETYFQPAPAPVVQAKPRHFKTHPAPLDDGPVISEKPVPKAPADADCPPGAAWDLCHWL